MKLIRKFKNSKVFKTVSSVFISAMIACMFCLNCFAAETSSAGDSAGAADALSSAFSSMQSDIFLYIGLALPVALVIVGAFFGIKKAIKFFTNIANKG